MLWFTDIAFKVEDQDGRYRVLFRRHAAIYYLSKTNAEASHILGVLRGSQNSQKDIGIQVDTDQLTILDAKAGLK